LLSWCFGVRERIDFRVLAKQQHTTNSCSFSIADDDDDGLETAS